MERAIDIFSNNTQLGGATNECVLTEDQAGDKIATICTRVHLFHKPLGRLVQVIGSSDPSNP